MAERVQLSRRKGWRMPPNTVSVARPTKWGNPYRDVDRYGLDLCLRLFRNTVRGMWLPDDVPPGTHRDVWLRWLYLDHSRWMERMRRHPAEAAQSELRGLNLACWCALDKPCHADYCWRLPMPANTPTNAGPIRELSLDERMRWGECPVCKAPHGTACYAAGAITLGVRADGRAPQDGDGAHLARLRRAPDNVREVPA